MDDLAEALRPLVDSARPAPPVSEVAARARRRRRWRVVWAVTATAAVAFGSVIFAVTGGHPKGSSVVYVKGGTSTTAPGPGLTKPFPTTETPVPTTVALRTPLTSSEAVSIAMKSTIGSVTRTAVKTMSYGTILSALSAAGFSVGSGPTVSPILPELDAPVDVVVLAGSAIYPEFARSTVPWQLEIVAPNSGNIVGAFANPTMGSWPSFFNSLPNSQ